MINLNSLPDLVLIIRRRDVLLEATHFIHANNNESRGKRQPRKRKSCWSSLNLKSLGGFKNSRGYRRIRTRRNQFWGEGGGAYKYFYCPDGIQSPLAPAACPGISCAYKCRPLIRPARILRTSIAREPGRIISGIVSAVELS